MSAAVGSEEASTRKSEWLKNSSSTYQAKNAGGRLGSNGMLEHQHVLKDTLASSAAFRMSSKSLSVRLSSPGEAAMLGLAHITRGIDGASQRQRIDSDQRRAHRRGARHFISWRVKLMTEMLPSIP